MTRPIEDKSAIECSRGFCDAHGEGLDVAGAFDEGVIQRLPVNAVLMGKGGTVNPQL